MREYIIKRLAEMKNTEERAFLKEVLSDVFLPLYDETQAKYDALEKNVREELPFLHEAFAVYSTVLPRERIDGSHAYLSPMFPEDANQSSIKIADIDSAINTVVETVFCEADYLKCQQIDRDKLTLEGVFIAGQERYPFKCRLESSDKYLNRIEPLHNTFLQNDVPWTTINGAYLYKFFDVRLIELSKLPKATEFLPNQIEISFGPYDGFVRRGLIPVWNIDRYVVKDESFPTPALDAINFEHHIDALQFGDDCGLLVDYSGARILFTRREGNSLVAVSPHKKELTFGVYRFRRRRDMAIEQYPYPVISNARKDSFSARLTARYGTHITTKAEMRKLLHSFDASDFVELADISFARDKIAGETYDLNPFICDEIHDPDFQKTLILSFGAKDREFFLNRDIASFLTSEFQAIYPEYRCVGVLL